MNTKRVGKILLPFSIILVVCMLVTAVKINNPLDDVKDNVQDKVEDQLPPNAKLLIQLMEKVRNLDEAVRRMPQSVRGRMNSNVQMQQLRGQLEGLKALLPSAPKPSNPSSVV